MLTTNEVAQVLETILSSPGMSDMVRIDMRISRKNVLLLHHLIERGSTSKGNPDSPLMLANQDANAINELRAISTDFLEKAGLVELHSKLMQLQQPDKKN